MMSGMTKREQRWKAEQQAAELTRLYGDLLYAVVNKYPGETRHQTALRYIQQAGATLISAAQKSPRHHHRAKRFRVPQDMDRPATPDAPSFDVIDPPEDYVRKYEGKFLDRQQHEDARKEIAACGYVYDDGAWRKVTL